MSNYFQSTILALHVVSNDDTIQIDNRDVLLNAIALLETVVARKVEKKTLKYVHISQMSSNKKYDDVVYYFETPRGSFGPYKARLPKGTIECLELKVGEGWEIQTEKIDGQWHWLEAFQAELEDL